MKVQVNDTIKYVRRGSPRVMIAKVLSLEICEDGEKYGRSVNSCDISKYRDGVADLSDGYWCYFSQIKGVI